MYFIIYRHKQGTEVELGVLHSKSSMEEWLAHNAEKMEALDLRDLVMNPTRLEAKMPANSYYIIKGDAIMPTPVTEVTHYEVP